MALAVVGCRGKHNATIVRLTKFSNVSPYLIIIRVNVLYTPKVQGTQPGYELRGPTAERLS